MHSQGRSRSSRARAAVSGPPWRRALAAEGVRLGLASRSGDDLGLAETIGVRCDVADPTQVDAAVAATVERFGQLDILVANAGVGAYGPFLELARRSISRR